LPFRAIALAPEGIAAGAEVALVRGAGVGAPGGCLIPGMTVIWSSVPGRIFAGCRMKKYLPVMPSNSTAE
jgi:hypothetical protein